jgi:DNA-binding NarL/FixJ family response regulator
MQMSVKVLVVDDMELVRLGLASMFERSEVHVVGAASSGAEAVQFARRHRPDVVLLDVRLGDEDGLDLIGRLRSAAPDCRVVVLSAFDNPTYVARAASAGAHDYLAKSIGRTALIDAVVGAARGAPPVRGGVMQKVSASLADRDLPPGAEFPLTPRETQVLRSLALGLSNREIAATFGISVETVKEHVQNLLRKTALGDRTQAAVWAIRQGLG